MGPAMIACERCGGSGRVPRVQRRRADGSPDPFDIVGQHSQICDKCAGSGEVPATLPPAPERGAGYAADLG
jgi:DnaJ-class molecular chaperone